MGHGIQVSHGAVELLMHRAGIQRISGRPRFRRVPHVATASDLVERQFHRDDPNRLWVTDITEHPTREGKVYCAVVLDAFSRRVVGWSIDASPSAALVTTRSAWPSSNATRSRNRDPRDQGTHIHVLGVHPASVDSGLLPSMGSVGDCYDNAMIESFWSRMQVELLDRQRGRPVSSLPRRSSTTSRSSTTASAATRRLA